MVAVTAAWRGRASGLAPLRAAGALAMAVTAVVLLAGSLPWLTGEDPARAVLRAREPERPPDPAVLDRIREELDLAASPVTGTTRWLGDALHGDLGRSWVSGEAVAPALVSGLRVSMTLSLLACGLALVAATALAAPSILRASRGRSSAGRPALVTGAVLLSLPEFVLAVVLVALVAVRWRLLPTSGWDSPKHMVLPVLALGLPAAGLMSRVLVGAVEATGAEAWVRTWRAAGVRRRVLVSQIARRAVAVTFPLLVLLLVGTLGAATVVEATFNIPGLGRTALNAALATDLPVVQGALALLVLLGLAIGAVGVVTHHLLVAPGLSGAGLAPAVVVDRGGCRAALGVLGVLMVGVTAGLLRDPAGIHVTRRLATPSLELPLGADPLGRDVLARLGHGAALTVGLAVLVSLVVLTVGLLIGLRARAGRAGLADVLNAVPSIFMGIVIAALLGPGLHSAFVAVALVAWIPLAVHARTLAAEARATGFAQAAVVAGASRARIVAYHLLPVVAPPVVLHALARIPANALSLAGLSYLGIGAPHDSPDWGKMLADNVIYLERAPWVILAPAGGLVLLGVAATLLRSLR